MKAPKSWRWQMKRHHFLFDRVELQRVLGMKMKQLPFMGVVCTVMLFIIYRTTIFQYQQTEMESKLDPFYTFKESGVDTMESLPRGIIEAKSDLELKPLWTTSSANSKVNAQRSINLLAMPVGIKQKKNVDTVVRKFLSENFTIVLFHYDGNLDGWWDLRWSKQATHIVALNQTKWWFAKRFLHPAIVSIYDYIFLWDEDLGVKNFHPGSFVEGMAPVFSRSAWHCAWHLIQNDLVHGWGMDIKLGYCAQGDRTKKIGVVDSEYVVHQSIQTLGGASARKAVNPEVTTKKHGVDVRLEIRKQSSMELQKFKERWERAVREDRNWVDPFSSTQRRRFWRYYRRDSKV
ncbi:uncharacterized protein LOC130985528 isoform X9 [Salvia miltiorrhiza]|uniref:uncharacterized protein LOC130985528 isoform X9 n=1 Tax=Salvia miltiorrhiza TaxID=226208 RepID=UPI0025ABF8C9|nr:uncharacterized protein LOC130985528 isoform X9 [Salvia miltiorrhiza]